MPPNTTLTGSVRQRRDGTDRVGPDRTGVPNLTESNEEPAAEVHLALTPGPDCADTQRPALDPRGQRRNTTRTGRTWTERETEASAGPGRSQETVLSAGWEQQRTGPRLSPPPDGDSAGGARKRRRDGETRRPFERKMATRKWLATDSGRVARAKDFCFVAKERGSTETSEDLSEPNS